VIKELEVMGLVQSEKSKDDARAVMITLTTEGRKFYEHIFGQLETLEETYKKVVGAKNYENALKVISQLNCFQEKMTKRDQ
jgi:DNA-binding MarR family transcriptional regulator